MKALYICATTHGTIRAERTLRRHKINVTVIPVPREVSSECGMAIELEQTDKTAAQKVIKKEEIDGMWYGVGVS